MKRALILLLAAAWLMPGLSAQAMEQKLETASEAYQAQALVCHWDEAVTTAADWQLCEQYLYELIGLAVQEVDLAAKAPALETEMRSLMTQISAVMAATALLTN